MVFTFAGGGNSNYTTYLCEMIVNIEQECSPALREAILSSMLINMTGEAGKFQPGDIIQEFLNRCLEPIIQRKDATFGSHTVREIWARNLKDIFDLKQHFRFSVGLGKRSARHKKPHERPEVRTLLKEFKATEVHKRRPGRSIGEDHDVDDMRKGIELLDGGVLKKWAARTVRSRGLSEDGPGEVDVQVSNEGHDEDGMEETEDGQEVEMTLGVLEIHDGEVVIMLEGEDELEAYLRGDANTANTANDEEIDSDNSSDSYGSEESE